MVTQTNIVVHTIINNKINLRTILITKSDRYKKTFCGVLTLTKSSKIRLKHGLDIKWIKMAIIKDLSGIYRISVFSISKWMKYLSVIYTNSAERTEF